MPVGAMEPYLAGNLIGFTVGLVISLLLLVLTARAAKLPGSPVSNVLLAVCSLFWNAGGLANLILNHQSSPPALGARCIPLAIGFTAAAIWPIPMLSIWRHLALERWQCVCWRGLEIVAAIDATVITVGVWSAVAGVALPLSGFKDFTAYSATLLLVAAIVFLLRGRRVSRALWFSTMIVMAGLGITSTAVILQTNLNLDNMVRCALGVVGQQSVLLVTLGAFFLFARFRFADLFIRYSVRLLLGSVLAAALVARFGRHVGGQTDYERAVHLFVSTVFATAVLVMFVPLERSVRRLVNRWIFHAPDYRNAARELGDRLRRLYGDTEVTAAVESAVRATLQVESARSIPLTIVPAVTWPPEIHQAEIIELEPCSPLASRLSLAAFDFLAPVRAEGRVASVLAISLGQARRGLVSQELQYLRSVADQFGSRLDLLRLEREMVERQNREALLMQQVTEAELRALRAQINPHFLFNSLNTIANLIATNPGRAETMTLRLAKVFRHVLAHSSRPMVPIREEMEFLRSYLEIEEARFGSRLQVEIDVNPEIAQSPVPSLILQPVVENALKHGLGPKVGPGRLWISARPEGDRIRLAVEDDGVGPNSNPNGAPSQGVGITNITERLKTLYHDRAQITLEPRIPAGMRVTLLVPRESVAAALS